MDKHGIELDQPDHNDRGIPTFDPSTATTNNPREQPPKRHKPEQRDPVKMEATNQFELLSWHERLGHLSMKKVQALARRGLLPIAISKCKVPLCQACIYGTMTRKAWRTKSPPNKISPNINRPGQHVSVDQLESHVPGLVGQLKGKLTKARYRCATIFVDTYSRASYVYLQQSTNAEETLEAKKAYEAFASVQHVTIHHYHADNGRFVENAWQQHANLSGQTLSYSGVGAHHQNGIAEKRIRDLQDLTQTSLIYATRKWPNAITTNLWTYALKRANASINFRMRGDLERTPGETFMSTDIPPNLRYEHPFGCPAYVLDRQMQAAIKAPKWQNRARLGVYLGASEHYARSTSLILSLSTGLVSPQYHVRHDDRFETVSPASGNLILIPDSEWQTKCGFNDKATGKTTRHAGVSIEFNEQSSIQQMFLQDTDKGMPLPPSTEGEVIVPIENIIRIENEGAQVPIEAIQPEIAPTSPIVPVPDVTARTSRLGRPIKTPQRYDDYVACEVIDIQEHIVTDTEQMSPIAYSTISDPDNLYFHQAMKAPDKLKFIRAMEEEIDGQTQNGNWELIARSALPPDARILPSVWAMRKNARCLMDPYISGKRASTSTEVNKYKESTTGRRTLRLRHGAR